MRKILFPLFFIILIIFIFRSWFSNVTLSSFDVSSYSDLMIRNAGFGIFAWGWNYALDGFSVFISPYSWIFPTLGIPQLIGSFLNLNWIIIERAFYLYPLLALLIFSPIVFAKYFFPKNKFYLISVLIFSFNTYALLLVSGETFVALSYSLVPLILVLFTHMLNLAEKKVFKYKFPLITGLVLALQVAFDPRVTYITIVAVILYSLFYCLININKFNKSQIKNYLHSFVFIFLVPLAEAILIQAFWIIPTVFYGKNPVQVLGAAYSSSQAVQYLSFAKFENTISLLHPNWSENIFGKVYFMRPEFLLIPVLAFASLLFINKLKNKQEKLHILFFAFLGLVGAFLAKGSNEPFGGIYLWLFNHFPGFELYRDPAKWYPLIAISYTVLISFSVWQIYDLINLKFKTRKFLSNLFLIVIILYLLILIRPAIFGQLGGMFKPTIIPKEYTQLGSFLYKQNQYFRTVWVPQKQRFGFYSNTHPEISAQALFSLYDNKKLLKKLSEKDSEKTLQESSIKYVVIPYDSQGEIFLSDRKYSEKEYEDTINNVRKITWLKEINGFGKIKVFQVPMPKDHFWLMGEGQIQYNYISPVEYKVNLKNVKKGELLVFSERFDSYWLALDQKSEVKSQRFNLFNSFKLQKEGNYDLDVYFQPQKWADIGLVISILSLASALGLLIFGYAIKKW